VNPIADARETESARPVRLPHALTTEEMMRIIQACIPTTAVGLRDRAVLELPYSTGIRKRELMNLSLGDF
jgi:site-specific recombinase XerD